MSQRSFIKRNAHKILATELERKRPLQRTRHRWENIKINLKVNAGL
jgi:hypothetical protein